MLMCAKAMLAKIAAAAWLAALATGDLLASHEQTGDDGHTSRVNSVVFSFDETLALTASQDYIVGDFTTAPRILYKFSFLFKFFIPL